MHYKKIFIGLALANMAVIPAVADVYSTRNYGMGGAGVASSDYNAAPGSNGALLTRFNDGDKTAWTLPAIGVEGSDRDSVIDTLDDIPDIYDELEFNIDNGNTQGALLNAEEIISMLEDVSGRPVRLNAGALIGFSRPSKTLGIAFDVRTSLEAGAIAAYDPDDKEVLLRAIATGDASVLDDTRSSGFALGAAVTEAALTLAREFSFGDGSALSLSVTPKYQRVDTLVYAVTVQDYNSNDFDDNTNDDAAFNVDVGAAYMMGENWVLGFRGRNLISEEYDTELVVLGNQRFQGTYQIEPTAVLGLAYDTGSFMATVEGDLLKNKGFESLNETQFLRAGMEYHAWNRVQLRLGYRYDMEENREDVVTAGLGISPWEAFHLNLSGSYGSNDTYGGALDFRMAF